MFSSRFESLIRCVNPWKPIVILADYFFGLVSFVGQAIDDIDWWFDDEPLDKHEPV